jgi:hypothetical protein
MYAPHLLRHRQAALLARANHFNPAQGSLLLQATMKLALLLAAGLVPARAVSCSGGSASFCDCATGVESTSCSEFRSLCTSCCSGTVTNFVCDDSLFGQASAWLFGTENSGCECIEADYEPEPSTPSVPKYYTPPPPLEAGGVPAGSPGRNPPTVSAFLPPPFP